jgi:pSer/pThr/pTyr-binding forkhead associated (FHA) protein
MVPGGPEDSTVKATSFGRNLRLPAGKRVSLHVASGKEKGKTHVCVQPLVAIGRGNVDFALDDPQVSQSHCVVEIMGERMVLRDLGSTNGTYVNGRPVQEAALEHMSEFRVGDHTIVVLVSPSEAPG